MLPAFRFVKCKKCRKPETKPKVKPVVTEKPCKECNEIKKIDDFPERKEAKDGHRNECKKCRDKKYPPKIIERENKKEYKCNTCNVMKMGSEFYKTASNMCAGCESIRSNVYRKTLNGQLREMVTGARGRSKMMNGADSEFYLEIDLEFDLDLDFDYIKNLYEEQEGMCYYSGIEMTTSGEYQMSLERLDESKGYIEGNVVLCCLEFNGQEQWSHMKIIDLIMTLDQNIEENIIDFSDITVSYNEKPRTKLYNLANSAKQRAIEKTASGRDMADYNLDVDFMLEMFKKQKGCAPTAACRCALASTRIPKKELTGS